jgi:hypothetical protein
MNPLILFGCATPLIIFFIVLKLFAWVNTVNDKGTAYNAYTDVDADEEEYGDRTDYL